MSNNDRTWSRGSQSGNVERGVALHSKTYQIRFPSSKSRKHPYVNREPIPYESCYKTSTKAVLIKKDGTVRLTTKEVPIHE